MKITGRKQRATFAVRSGPPLTKTLEGAYGDVDVS